VSPDHGAELAAMEGQSVGPPQIGREVVNAPMIRHWVEAMGDRNPVYTSPEAAAAAGLGDVMAPPTMLQTWIMAGLEATLERERRRADGSAPQPDSAFERVLAMLDDEGRTSVVATNSQQHYVRPLRLGERLVMATTIESVTPPKRTALGDGRFVTTRMEFRSMADPDATGDATAAFDTGELVATMRWSILKFIPKERSPERPSRSPPRAREHRRATQCGSPPTRPAAVAAWPNWVRVRRGAVPAGDDRPAATPPTRRPGARRPAARYVRPVSRRRAPDVGPRRPVIGDGRAPARRAALHSAGSDRRPPAGAPSPHAGCGRRPAPPAPPCRRAGSAFPGSGTVGPDRHRCRHPWR